MGKFSTQQNFVGELDGTTAHEISSKVDYTKTKLADRKEHVEELLNENNFFPEYFADYFKPNINVTDFTSESNNVCKTLEKMANYLLNSDEIKAEDDKEKTVYVFHTDERYFQEKVGREASVEAFGGETGSFEEVIHFLVRDQENFKKSKDQRISSSDLNREGFVGEVLRNYQQTLDFVTKELKSGNSKINRYLLTNTSGEIRQDMLYSKDALLGTFAYRTNAEESTEPDMDVFDFTNKSHIKGKRFTFVGPDGKETKINVKGLMYFKPKYDPNSEFDLVLIDFQKTVDKANLTDMEKEVLEMLRSQYSNVEVQKELEIDKSKFESTVNGIVSKIVKVGEKYDLRED